MSGLTRILTLLIALTFAGVIWFRFVADWPWIDSLYMTVITLSTVGYAEVRPLSNADKLFVAGYLTLGLGIFLYCVVQIGESIVRAELGQWWRQRNMSQSIEALRDHFIVCGSGRMGRLLCEDLASRNISFVVVDSDESIIESCVERGWRAICADVTDDETLVAVGIQHAAGLAATLGGDADNLYVVLSARLVNSDVRIVARAHDERSASKLKKAGANRVVSPYESGAAKMGQLLTNPRLNEFVEIIADQNISFDLVGVPVSAESPWAGKALLDTDFRARGIMVVAVRHQDGSVDLAPSGRTVLSTGDELFALGNTDAIEEIS